MSSRSIPVAALCVLGLLATACGGGKRKAENARSERPSTLPGSAAPAAPATAAATAEHCQVAGFAYAVPGPGNILPPSAATAATATAATDGAR